MPPLRRYDLVARVYDTVSLERGLYGGPRRRALDLVGTHAADTVLDLGCGTGFNFPRLVDSIGPDGRVIGVDASAGMLSVAQQRIRAAGWRNVTLIRGDVTELTAVLRHAGLGQAPINAANPKINCQRTAWGGPVTGHRAVTSVCVRRPVRW